MNRQKERSSLSTRRLLDAAGELISEGGYAAMTLAAVGERAGYSRGLVTARFGSKRELVEALVERITTVWNARYVQPGTVGRSGLDGLLLTLDAIRAQSERDPRDLRTLYALQFEALGQVPELRSHFVEFHRTMRADMAGFVRRGLRDGSVVAGTSPKAEGAAVVGALRGIGYQWLLDPDEIDPTTLLSHLIVCLDRRLRAPQEATVVIHPNRFDGRVAVVTGGAGAFGTAIASQLAAEAAKVVVADLDLDAARRVATTLGGDAIACRLDVTQPDSVVEAIAVAEQQFGGLDLLVNNAGLTHRITPLEELPDEAFDLVFDVNVKGTFLCSKHAIGALRRRGGGAIVNISSVAAIAHRSGNVVYSASKAAVAAFTRNLAVELAPTIRVNAVMPVAADTPFMVAAFGERLPAEAAEAMRDGLPLGRLCTPTDVADAVAYLASGDAAFVTGVCLPVDGGRSLG